MITFKEYLAEIAIKGKAAKITDYFDIKNGELYFKDKRLDYDDITSLFVHSFVTGKDPHYKVTDTFINIASIEDQTENVCTIKILYEGLDADYNVIYSNPDIVQIEVDDNLNVKIHKGK